jgi:hypothetical protein
MITPDRDSAKFHHHVRTRIKKASAASANHQNRRESSLEANPRAFLHLKKQGFCRGKFADPIPLGRFFLFFTVAK